VRKFRTKLRAVFFFASRCRLLAGYCYMLLLYRQNTKNGGSSLLATHGTAGGVGGLYQQRLKFL
jgi:hypothetical protein